MKKKSTILWLATALCLIVTVGLWFAVNGSEVDYTEVSATVISSDTSYRKVMGKRQAVYEVTVEYNGVTYDLENVYSAASYFPGKSTTVYEANGHLYANTDGVKTSTPLATLYFVFLFGSFGMIGLSLYMMSKEKQKKKELEAKVSADAPQ
ncbi:MAG: penicillin-binding protein [Oscillospiraceae bacterium]|nr:penicillin-binding protein [Oscillospiraceae bacterium]